MAHSWQADFDNMAPPPEEEHRRKLELYMESRRGDLRLTWDDIAQQAGLSKEGLRKVRQGTGAIRPLTRRGIEDALKWEPGSIGIILAGGEPIPLLPPERDPDVRGADESPEDWMDRQYDLWKKDRHKRRVLRGLFESWDTTDGD